MRITNIMCILISLILVLGLVACTEEQDAEMRDRTDLGLGELVKAKDRSLSTSITQSLNSEPRLTQYKLKAEVSHDMIVLTGTVSSEREKELAYEIVTSIDLGRIKSENIQNDIQIDPSLEPILGPDFF